MADWRERRVPQFQDHLRRVLGREPTERDYAAAVMQLEGRGEGALAVGHAFHNRLTGAGGDPAQHLRHYDPVAMGHRWAELTPQALARWGDAYDRIAAGHGPLSQGQTHFFSPSGMQAYHDRDPSLVRSAVRMEVPGHGQVLVPTWATQAVAAGDFTNVGGNWFLVPNERYGGQQQAGHPPPALPPAAVTAPPHAATTASPPNQVPAAPPDPGQRVTSSGAAVGQIMASLAQPRDDGQDILTDMRQPRPPTRQQQPAPIPYARPAPTTDPNREGAMSATPRMGVGPRRAAGGGISPVPRARDTSAQVATFAGPNATTADREALARAEQMETAGRPREDIWKDTGWFRGVDGHWRFEISDHDMAVRPHARDLPTLPASQAIHHPALFRAYPSLGDVPVSRQVVPGYEGSVDNANRLMTLTPRGGWRHVDGVAGHELQHGVQNIERFAPGGTPSTRRPELDQLLDRWSNELQRLDAYPSAEEAVLAFGGDTSWVDRGGDEALDRSRAARQAYEAVEQRPLSAAEAFENYRRLAGETEARTTAKRLPLTPEQRRARPPWLDYDVPEAQQVVRPRSTGGGIMPDDTGVNVPETPGSLAAQQSEMLAGRRPAQMFPLGTMELPLPQGYARVITPRGVFHFDPMAVSALDILAASSMGRENEVLGLGPLSKPDVLALAADRGETPVAVTERDPFGNELRASTATPSTVPVQANHILRTANPESSVGVEPIEDVVDRRGERAIRLARAEGGGIGAGAPVSGAVVGSTGGRADRVPATARAGSHVIPADVVAHLGQGNSLAGMRALERMFRTGPYGMTLARRRAHGGGIGDVPVMISDGEFVVPPDVVTEIGGGDLGIGHDAIDEWIMSERQKSLAAIAALPPPATD